jgi:GNAT superfamily N-acetyltransferase
MTVHYKLRNYSPTLEFEKYHPKNIRWDDTYKLWMLEENNKCQGFWVKEKDKLVGEMIVSWDSSNVLHGESITVSPDHRRKGIATKLVNLMLDWGEQSGYELFVGEARKKDSWSVFENLGAVPLYLYKNWCETGEEYMFFKMEI